MATISGGDRPDRIEIARMTAGVFDVLGARPMLGRTFVSRDNEPDAAPTAILGYSVWRDRYASDSAAIGKSIRVNGKQYTIVGVMSEKFQFPGRGAHLASAPAQCVARAGRGRRRSTSLGASVPASTSRARTLNSVG